MIKVGLTGGIGAGKSTIGKVFKTLGIPVFDSDQFAKATLNQDEVRGQLIDWMGKHVYDAGIPNRVEMAKLLFNDDALREKVNGLIHPRVRTEFVTWVARQQSPYVIQEAAILFETGGYKHLDFNVLVIAPEELRLKRVLARDDVSEHQVKQRMARQWSDDRKRELADFEIVNDDQSMVLPQVIQIHEKLSQQT